MHHREREVLELPLHVLDAEAVRKRRVDVEGLLRDPLLLLLGERSDRPHVVEAVGQLDEQDTHVLRHRHEHLAHRGGLLRLLGVELQPVELGDAVDDRGQVGAEVGDEVVDRDRRVLDCVMEQRRTQRHVVEAEVGEDHRDPERVRDVGVARPPDLVLVGLAGDVERVLDQGRVRARVPRVERVEQRPQRRVDRCLVPARQDGLHGIHTIRHIMWSTPIELCITDNRVNVLARQLLPAREELELDEEREPGHLAAEPFDQAHHGRGGAAGREHVVDDEHPLPRLIASRWISSRSVPYSSSYSSRSISHGSFPALRTGTNPAVRLYATGAANTKPRASIPSTLSTRRPSNGCARASTARLNASACASNGVMSLKMTPGFG